MALQTLQALWATGKQFPITTLEFTLNLMASNSSDGWMNQQEVKLYYALSEEDLTLDNQVYSASCFSVALPERSDNTFQDLTFSIGSVNKEILGYMSRILRNDGKDLNYVKLAQWHPQTLVCEYEIEMVINSVHFSGPNAQFTASFADLVNTEFPRLRYTAERAPGIVYVSN